MLARLLGAQGADVNVVLTASAQRFIGIETFAALTGNPVHTSLWEQPGGIVHVGLAHSADLAIVAPATANVMAKLANGLADDLLTATLLEARCPLVIAPAMHTGMWEHPATRSNVARLEERGVTLVGPASGALAAGDEGVGRMAEPADIAAAGRTALGLRDLGGVRVVVTAGPTQEPIDPVRFIGNRSSGRMGVAIAAEAASRGAVVHLVLGPGTVRPPAGLSIEEVSTAEEMRAAVLAALEDADAVVMAAAVSDFRPKVSAEEKLKKDAGIPELHLEPTPDILRELGERKGNRILIGFAAETQDLLEAGRRKLQAKHLDLIVVNRVGREGTGFGSDTNEAMLLTKDGSEGPLRMWTKVELAAAICDRLVVSEAARPSRSRP